jgi:alcohol dehydrogenase
MMKAFIVDSYGSMEGVRAGDMPDPELQEDDVLVQIHAAGVNPLDSKIRDGDFKLFLPYHFPLILGNEVAGVVVRVGSGVRRFKPGDEVYARSDTGRIGAFAEFIAIQEAAVAQKPKNLTMEEAASIPLVGLTAWQVLVERAQLSPGQKVLIHAGSGGVGTIAIQLAKHLGAIVATTTSTQNLDWVKRLGADMVIDYRKDAFENILHDYDVVLSSLGAVLVFALVNRLSRRPIQHYRIIATIVLLISFVPDLLLLSVSGTNRSDIAALMMMHIATYLVTVGMLTTLTRAK